MAVSVYRLTSSPSFGADFALRDRMRRAAVSIDSNIAEGDERYSNQESIRFFYIANGSLAELITQLLIAREIGYIEENEASNHIDELEKISMTIEAVTNHGRETK